ncbi:MAG: hypothetical protein Q8O67_10910 [Deltaproteobacteria bacterium]|nr:hypothetical protein [Deltaproteobacteria bacterium]
MRRLGLPFLLLTGLLAAGADCAPQTGIAEAADCCACLAKAAPDGDEASASDNCLPDDLSQGLSQSVESDQCAADAADSLSGQGDVVVDAACLQAVHPCSAICAEASDSGVVFAE